jgi:copper(I)-binding protein
MQRALLIIAALVALAPAALAHKFEKGGLVIHHPWTRATPEGATVAVGYLSITNNGPDADRLTGGTFEDAGNVEIHEMKMDGDKMTMRELKDGLVIKPGETAEFKPNSNHLMFTGLKKPLAKGTNVKGSLTFEKAGSVDVSYKVESIGAMSSSDSTDSHMDHMDHMDMQMDGSGKMHDKMP